jgi:hypothetical protein
MFMTFKTGKAVSLLHQCERYAEFLAYEHCLHKVRVTAAEHQSGITVTFKHCSLHNLRICLIQCRQALPSSTHCDQTVEYCCIAIISGPAKRNVADNHAAYSSRSFSIMEQPQCLICNTAAAMQSGHWLRWQSCCCATAPSHTCMRLLR